MKKILITNNPLVKEKYSNEITVEFYEVEYLQILENTRNKIHLGNKLLSHPLSGSVKPYETPYKTIIIGEANGKLDMDSLMIIEQSIDTTKKFMTNKEITKWNVKTLADFQVIDLSLIESALDSVI